MSESSKPETPFILLAVSDAQVKARLERQIQQMNFEYDILDDGLLARQWLDEDLPDILVLEAKLEKLDGIRLCRQLRGNARTATLPIIFTIDMRDHEDLIQGIQAGGDAFLSYPFHPVVLSSWIQSLFERKKRQMRIFEREKQIEKRFESFCERLIPPLDGIDAYSKTLGSSLNPIADQGTNIKNIQLSSHRIRKGISTVLDLTRMEREGSVILVEKNITLNGLINQVYDIYTETSQIKGILLKQQQLEDAPVLFVDSDRILRLLDEIIEDSLHRVEGGGIIITSAKRSQNGGLDIFIEIDSNDKLKDDYEGKDPLTMPFCATILKLHGGKLHLKQDENSCQYRLQFPDYRIVAAESN
jgi:DNA-binding response OmpR family regulator